MDQLRDKRYPFTDNAMQTVVTLKTSLSGTLPKNIPAQDDICVGIIVAVRDHVMNSYGRQTSS
jgi:hypothetical protein